MTTTAMTQGQFLRDLGKGATVDLGSLSKPVEEALTKAGVTRAELESIAGKDGKISGPNELKKLYNLLDGYDGKADKKLQVRPDSAGGATPPTGTAFEALKSEVAANRAVAQTGVSVKSGAKKLEKSHGVLDLNNLGADTQKALDKAGVTKDELAKIAGADGQIKGGEMKALTSRLDAADGKADGTIATQTKNADGTLSKTAAGEAFAAVEREVAANRKDSRYQQPGVKAATKQTRRTIDKDAVTVAAADQKPVDLKMKGVDQFSLYPNDPEKGGKACGEAATKACTDHLKKNHGGKAPKLAGADQAIQIGVREDKNGRLEVDPTQAKLGREYIDKALDKGYPVVVGVSYADNAYNGDKMTDHFVTIDKRGYDAKGRLYYEFKDPGDGGRADRFYVDQTTGKLFKEGDGKTGYVKSADYEVTQVRTYKE